MNGRAIYRPTSLPKLQLIVTGELWPLRKCFKGKVCSFFNIVSDPAIVTTFETPYVFTFRYRRRTDHRRYRTAPSTVKGTETDRPGAPSTQRAGPRRQREWVGTLLMAALIFTRNTRPNEPIWLIVCPGGLGGLVRRWLVRVHTMPLVIEYIMYIAHTHTHTHTFDLILMSPIENSSCVLIPFQNIVHNE